MIVVDNIIQGGAEWFAEKAGKPSASQFSQIATSTGKRSTSFKPYAFKKAAELETGKIEDTFKSPAMDRGAELEPRARDAYTFITGIEMDEVGVVYRDEKRLWLCSPDGLNLEKRIGLEIKCPLAGTHKQYCHEGKIPTKYKAQVFGSLWICDEVDRWAFMSYHPDMKPFILTVDREDVAYQTYIKAIAPLLLEFTDFVKQLNTRSAI